MQETKSLARKKKQDKKMTKNGYIILWWQISGLLLKRVSLYETLTVHDFSMTEYSMCYCHKALKVELYNTKF